MSQNIFHGTILNFSFRILFHDRNPDVEVKNDQSLFERSFIPNSDNDSSPNFVSIYTYYVNKLLSYRYRQRHNFKHFFIVSILQIKLRLIAF